MVPNYNIDAIVGSKVMENDKLVKSKDELNLFDLIKEAQNIREVTSILIDLDTQNSSDKKRKIKERINTDNLKLFKDLNAAITTKISLLKKSPCQMIWNGLFRLTILKLS